MDAYANDDWDRLDRFVRGDGTPEELDDLRRWVEADPELVALVRTMRTIGRPTEAEPSLPDTRAAWRRLQREVRRSGRRLRVAGSGDLGGPRWHRWSWGAVAAAATVAAAAGASLVARRAELSADSAAVADLPMRELVASRGQRGAFNLPDGSRVVMAPETRLRIPATYRATTGPRDVHLDGGEAYFEVEHDDTRPFRVRTAHGVAEDLGTTFVVAAYPEVRGTRVVVVTGEVALWGADRRKARSRPLLTLAAGDLGQLDSMGSATLTSNVNTAPYSSWVSGTLVFDGTRLDEAVLRLARWYNLDLRLADSALARRRVTATLHHQSAAAVLESIRLAFGVRVQRKGETIVLSAGRK